MPSLQAQRSMTTVSTSIDPSRQKLLTGDWVIDRVELEGSEVRIHFFFTFVLIATVTVAHQYESDQGGWSKLPLGNMKCFRPNPLQVVKVVGSNFGRYNARPDYVLTQPLEVSDNHSFGEANDLCDDKLAVCLIRELLKVFSHANCGGIDFITKNPEVVQGWIVSLQQLDDPGHRILSRVIFASSDPSTVEEVEKTYAAHLSTQCTSPLSDGHLPSLQSLRNDPLVTPIFGDDASHYIKGLTLHQKKWQLPEKLTKENIKARWDQEVVDEETLANLRELELISRDLHNVSNFFTRSNIKVSLEKLDVQLRHLMETSNMEVDGSMVAYKVQKALFCMPADHANKFNTVFLKCAEGLGISCWVEFWDPSKTVLPRWIESKWPTVACFDMDSTLIEEETIDVLAKKTGRQDEVMQITKMAMNGRLKFRESLSQRMNVFQGMEWEDIQRSFVPTLTEGAGPLISLLRREGLREAALVSGGFIHWAGPVARTLGLDYAVANQFGVDESGRMTGKFRRGTMVVDGEQKANLMYNLTMQHVPREELIPCVYSMAVGDGNNDREMLQQAYPFGVVFNGKDILRQSSSFHINERNMLLIYVMIKASFPPEIPFDHRRLEGE